MNKDEYLYRLNYSIKHYEHDPVNLIKLPFLALDSDTFIDFTEDYFELADQDWERQKDHYPDEGNVRVRDNMNLSYGKHNTFLLKYGNNGDTNEKLKELFGFGNLSKLNLIPDTVLMRLIVKLPGHGIAIHLDDASTYIQKFSLEYKEKAKRLWFPVSQWEDGHFFQISDKVLSHWSVGDGYEIPWGVPHLGVNFGLKTQFTLNITGVTYG